MKELEIIIRQKEEHLKLCESFFNGYSTEVRKLQRELKQLKGE